MKTFNYAQVEEIEGRAIEIYKPRIIGYYEVLDSIERGYNTTLKICGDLEAEEYTVRRMLAVLEQLGYVMHRPGWGKRGRRLKRWSLVPPREET